MPPDIVAFGNSQTDAAKLLLRSCARRARSYHHNSYNDADDGDGAQCNIIALHTKHIAFVLYCLQWNIEDATVTRDNYVSENNLKAQERARAQMSPNVYATPKLYANEVRMHTFCIIQ